MKAYCEDSEGCRHALLLAYFGEQLAGGRCNGRCDNCLRRAGQREDPDWPPQVEPTGPQLPAVTGTVGTGCKALGLPDLGLIQ